VDGCLRRPELQLRDAVGRPATIAVSKRSGMPLPAWEAAAQAPCWRDRPQDPLVLEVDAHADGVGRDWIEAERRESTPPEPDAVAVDVGAYRIVGDRECRSARLRGDTRVAGSEHAAPRLTA